MKATKHIIMAITAIGLAACTSQTGGDTQETTDFEYANERFADLQMLRYKVEGFENLTLNQKLLIYHLSEAAMYGRDILYDQNGRYNLTIRQMLENIYTNEGVDHTSDDFKAMEVYLKRVWFSNGVHHHYGSEKFVPEFSEEWLRQQIEATDALAESPYSTDEICQVIFDPTVMPKRVNLAEGVDLLKTSASNYYDGVTQKEAEDFYLAQKEKGDKEHPVM